MATYSRPSQPLSVRGVIDDGLRLYGVSLGALFLPSLVLAAVSEGQSLALMFMVDPRDPASVGPAFLRMLPAMFGVSVFACYVYAALIDRLERIASGQPSTLLQALATGARRFLPLLAGWILLGIAVIAGLLLVVPGTYLMVSLSFVSFPVVLDGCGPIAGLKISHRLVKGLWWRTATLVSVALLIVTVPYLFLGIMLWLVAIVTAGDVATLAITQWLIASVTYAFLLPLLLCQMYSIYRDLRLRKASPDIQQIG